VAHPLLIALALLVTLTDAGAGPARPAGVAAAWTLAPLAAAWLVAHAVIRAAGRRLDRTGDPAALRRAESAAKGYGFYLFLHAGIAFVSLGWLAAVRAAVGDLVLVDEALAAAPFLLALMAGWWSFAPIERRLVEATMMRSLDLGEPVHPAPSAGQIVTDRARHLLGIGVVVIGVIVAWAEVVVRAAESLAAEGAIGTGEATSAGVAVAQLAVSIPVLFAAPLLIRVIWRTAPLAAGELHERIAGLCARLGVRYRTVLIWRTRGAMLNGAVVGLVAPLRYILLTDALIERLPVRELDAVVAHEAAHVKMRHLPWLLFTTGVAAAAAGVATAVYFEAQARLFPGSAEGAEIVVLAAGVAAAVMAFGMASRRFERQADAFAARALSEDGEAPSPVVTEEAAETMAAALRRVARLNHVPTGRFGFRHGSIATRVRNLRGLIGVQTDELPIDRGVAWLKRWVVGTAALTVLAVGALAAL